MSLSEIFQFDFLNSMSSFSFGRLKLEIFFNESPNFQRSLFVTFEKKNNFSYFLSVFNLSKRIFMHENMLEISFTTLCFVEFFIFFLILTRELKFGKNFSISFYFLVVRLYNMLVKSHFITVIKSAGVIFFAFRIALLIY